jgi:hypothetical protein
MIPAQGTDETKRERSGSASRLQLLDLNGAALTPEPSLQSFGPSSWLEGRDIASCCTSDDMCGTTRGGARSFISQSSKDELEWLPQQSRACKPPSAGKRGEGPCNQTTCPREYAVASMRLRRFLSSLKLVMGLSQRTSTPWSRH